MSHGQIVSLFNINNTNTTEEANENIREYVSIVVEFLNDIYDLYNILGNEIDVTELEPVIEKKKNSRCIKEVNEKLGKYKKIGVDDILVAENNSCSICCEVYKPGEYKRELCCSHIFHKKCIDKWLCGNDNCPMCRINIINS